MFRNGYDRLTNNLSAELKAHHRDSPRLRGNTGTTKRTPVVEGEVRDFRLWLDGLDKPVEGSLSVTSDAMEPAFGNLNSTSAS